MRTLITILAAVTTISACGAATTADGTRPTDSPGDSGTTDDNTDDPLGGACGKITRESMTILGAVEYADKSGPAVGASVWLEERSYSGQGSPEQWGKGKAKGKGTVTNKNGTFQIVIDDVIAPVGDCWFIVDYHLVAELGDLSGSDGVTQSVFNAVTFDVTADLTDIPILIE